MVKEEVVEHPIPMQSKEQSTDWELMKDIIQVFKIYKLLQRMKNKWCLKEYIFSYLDKVIQYLSTNTLDVNLQ